MVRSNSHDRHFADWEDVRDAVSDAYFPHVLQPLTAGAAAGAAVGTADLGTCRITHMELSADVSVVSDHPGAYGINIPVSGHLMSVVGGTEVVSGIGQATACPPNTRTLIPRWETSCRLVGFKIDEVYLDREMERILDRPPSPLPLQLNLDTPNGRSWTNFVRLVYDEFRKNSQLMTNDVMREQLAGAITAGFVLAAVHTDEPTRPGTRPRIVRRVQSAIDSDPSRAWTPADMCVVAGVSVRRLQQGFREYVGMTPFEYLSGVRLELAHRELLGAGPNATVTDIAFRCGITHTGRFAAAYRLRFGELPSDTLSR